MFNRRPRLSWPFFHAVCLTLIVCLSICGCRTATEVTPVIHKHLLTIVFENPYLSLDPQARNDSVTWSVIGNLYEPLVEFDRNMKIEACLAERWENPNNLTWRFFLRKNIKFQDGSALTAKDVAYTIQRGISESALGTKPYLISVKGAKAVDDLTVDIITDRPNPVLLNRLTFVFILKDGDGKGFEIKKPNGTGPYGYQSEPSAGKLILQANPNYWRGKAAIDRVQIVYFDSPDRMVDLMLEGNAQLIRDFPENLFPKMEACKTCKIVTHDGLGVTFLGFNLSANSKLNPAFNPSVRKAIALSLNPEKLVQNAMEGTASVARQLVSPVIFGYDPAFAPLRPDPEEARQLLAGAGFKKGFQTEIFGNDELRLVELSNQLRTLQIDAEPRLVGWQALNDKILKKEASIYTLSWNCSTGDASDFLDSCIHSPNPEAGYGNFNLAGYRNPQVDTLIELSGETLKPNERKEYLQKALALAARDIPYIPLYSRYRHYGVSDELVWQPRLDGRLYAYSMSWKSQ